MCGKEKERENEKERVAENMAVEIDFFRRLFCCVVSP